LFKIKIMKNLLKAIADFQKEVSVLKQTRVNEFAKFNYYDYTDVVVGIKEAMTKNGLVFIHEIAKESLTTRVIHVESGEEIKAESDILKLEMKGMNSYQVMGSGISYIKKYHLTSLLGIATDEKSMDELIQARKPQPKPSLSDERLDKAIEAIKNGNVTKEKVTEDFQLTDVQLEKLNQSC
jgi:hypothetical protein